MPVRETAPRGAPCWVDLSTPDVDRSRRFYSELFGWTAEEPQPEFGGYFDFLREGIPVAGCMGSPPDGPNTWSVYLATDDARGTLEAATAHGGQVAVPAMDVADLGTMGVAVDSGGAGIGVWQSRTFPGFGVLAEPGAPSWFELQAGDYQGALSFYREVFAWDTRVVSDTPEFRYTVLVRGDDMLAGIMDAAGFLPDGVGGIWSVYFGTADADATLARVTELGGSVVRPAEDTPYGRLAEATNPNGAHFKLVAGNAATEARSA